MATSQDNAQSVDTKGHKSPVDNAKDPTHVHKPKSEDTPSVETHKSPVDNAKDPTHVHKPKSEDIPSVDTHKSPDDNAKDPTHVHKPKSEDTPSVDTHKSPDDNAKDPTHLHKPKSGDGTTGSEEPKEISQDNKPSESENKLDKSDISEGAAHKQESKAAAPHASHGEEKLKGTVDKDAKPVPPCFRSTQSTLDKEALLDHIRGTIYGNCIGDAIGLLTEFMTKDEATYTYSNDDKISKNTKGKETFSGNKQLPELEYYMKCSDPHRDRWATGDWTDDSDQMILILLSLVANNGKMDPEDFAKRLENWRKKGFKKLGDKGGMGIGGTTYSVLRHLEFLTNPHKAATDVWECSGRYLAPNGGVMRTSILGIHDFGNIGEVIANTMAACKVTHADPRCIASCVAVTTAVAIMLQGKHLKESGVYDVDAVINEAYGYACDTLEIASEQEQEELKKELEKYMFAKSLDDLRLDENGKIGYTYKCMGAGFWSLRQDNFRTALEAITYEGGDADTNGAVAGALLGCKLGASALPPTWLNGLKHKEWLDKHIGSFLTLLGLNE